MLRINNHVTQGRESLASVEKSRVLLANSKNLIEQLEATISQSQKLVAVSQQLVDERKKLVAESKRRLNERSIRARSSITSPAFGDLGCGSLRDSPSCQQNRRRGR